VSSNMALNLPSFGRWTLRDKAAQRRLALRWALAGDYTWNSMHLLPRCSPK
jgi:hypothetical protein